MLLNVVYLAGLMAASPWILYRRLRHGRYRRGIGQKLFGLSAKDASGLTADGPCHWIHAVSLGEVQMIRRLVHRLDAISSVAVVVSVSTDTGYDEAVKHFGKGRVFFAPLDFSWAVQRTLRNLRCKRLTLAELELWPNLIQGASAAGVTTCVVNGRLSERSARGYLRFGFLFRRIFALISAIGCQDRQSADRFVRCGADESRVTVTGNLKFDNAPDRRDHSDVLNMVHRCGIDPWHRVWVAGSTGPGEEAMVMQIYQSLRKLHQDLRLVIVPRHPERFAEVAKMISDGGFATYRLSLSEPNVQWSSDEIVLGDTMGELRTIWGVAHIATVGGSFGNRGGQNMIEPAAYGAAVSFGPDVRNFDYIAKQLVPQRGAIQVADASELQRFVQRCLEDAGMTASLGNAARELVDRHRGAMERTLRLVTGQDDVADQDDLWKKRQTHRAA